MASDKQKLIAAAFLVVAFLFYSFFLYASLPSNVAPNNEESMRGKMVWQKYNCSACHQVYGLGGYLGPDLTNEYSLRDTSFIKIFLSQPYIFTPVMPKFDLSESEMTELVAFFKSIDATGKSDQRTFKSNYDGTIEQE